MNQIRTTISLDEQIHRQLALSAVKTGRSLSDIVNSRLANKNFGLNASQYAITIAADLDFFSTLSKKVGKTNWAKLVREERDRDLG